MTKNIKSPPIVTHIDTDRSLHTRQPLCGEYRRYAHDVVDGMAYMEPGWQIPPQVTCPNCLRIGRYYAQGATVTKACRLALQPELMKAKGESCPRNNLLT